MVCQKVEFWKELHNFFSAIDIAREPIPWKKSIKGGTEQTGGSWTHTRCKCKFTRVFSMIFFIPPIFLGGHIKISFFFLSGLEG